MGGNPKTIGGKQALQLSCLQPRCFSPALPNVSSMFLGNKLWSSQPVQWLGKVRPDASGPHQLAGQL